MRRLIVTSLLPRPLALALTPALAVMAAALPAPAAVARPFRDAAGIHVMAQAQLGPRLLALTLSTPALAGPANVRVLLPSGYARHPRRRYPVLYLLHGTSGGAADWTTYGDAQASTAGRPLIVVMPDIALGRDGGGWCTNWYNGGAFGRPQWETFHIDELIPWIDSNLRTIRSRRGRAIAGLSQGGFCSMSYAARHPDLFSTALSFSGAPDTANDLEAQTLVTPVINLTEVGLDRVPANSMFGDRLTQEINWAAHDPTTLAVNLRDTNLLMFTGNGRRGPLDPAAQNSFAGAIEAGVEQLTILFHRHLQELGIPSFFDDYGPGTHSWPYWTRDLRQSIGAIMADFAHPPASPRQITYTSADPQYSIYGWQVRTQRKVREFSTLEAAGAGGFTLAGSGSATVLTPPVYKRGGSYSITVRWRGGTEGALERADRGGRLTIAVPLGPSDTIQQYAVDGTLLGTTVYRSQVAIARRPG